MNRPGRRRHPTALVVLGILALGLAACGSGDQAAHGTTPTTGHAASAPTPATGTGSAAPHFIRTWTLTSSNGAGASEKVTVSVGRVERFSPQARDGSLVAGDLCHLSARSDALVPAVLVMTNTSPAAPITVGAGLTGPPVQWEVTNPGGPPCEDSPHSGPPLDLQSLAPIAPGKAQTYPFFFVVRHYYPTGGAQGDAALLDTRISITGLAVIDNFPHISETLVGPGATSNPVPGFSNFALSGATSPDR